MTNLNSMPGLSLANRRIRLHMKDLLRKKSSCTTKSDRDAISNEIGLLKIVATANKNHRAAFKNDNGIRHYKRR
jgi:hypothetical protein